MSNCKYCKHWGTGPNGAQLPPYGNYQRCLRVLGSGWLHARAEEGGGVGIGTAPYFSCALYESKEPING
jgi:hypothetical protein